MASAEQLMVISTPNKLEVGEEIESLSVIPHLTLFPWMTIQSSQWEEFDMRMKDILAFTLARNWRGAKESIFGTPEKPVRVRELHGSDYDLRNDIANIAIDLNAQYDPTFTELNTTSHISATPDFELQEGELFPISAMTVISKDLIEKQKAVKAIYKWSKPSRWYL